MPLVWAIMAGTLATFGATNPTLEEPALLVLAHELYYYDDRDSDAEPLPPGDADSGWGQMPTPNAVQTCRPTLPRPCPTTTEPAPPAHGPPSAPADDPAIFPD